MPTPRLYFFLLFFLFCLIAAASAADSDLHHLGAGDLQSGTSIQQDTTYVDLSDPLPNCGSPPRLYAGFTISALSTRALRAGDVLAFTMVTVDNVSSTAKTGWSAGLQCEYLLNNPKDAMSAVLVGVNFVSLPALLTGDTQVPLEFGNGTTSLSDAVYEKQTSLSLLNIDILYKHLIGYTRFAVQAGTSVGVVLDGGENETISPTNSEARFVHSNYAAQQGITFSDDMRAAKLAEHDIDNINRMQISLLAGVCYELSIRKWIISPYVRCSFPLTSVQSTTGLKISFLQAGIEARMAIGMY